MFDLTGKGALVTGATGGIGWAIAEALHEQGATVAISGTRAERLNELAAKLGSRVVALPCDLRDRAAVLKLAEDAEKALGQVDILVNNAGITRDAMFHKMTLTQWQDVLNTNLNALFNMTSPIWGGMRDRSFGRIVCISSINGQKGQMGQANYAAAKAGEIGFVKSLAQEGAAKGITVNAICPGYIGTEMVKAVPEKVMNERILPHIPVGRIGEPEEIARCVSFLVADDAGFITGATLTANGGQYMV